MNMRARLLAASIGFVAATTGLAQLPSLGSAADYAVIGLDDVDTTISSGNTVVHGNVAVGSNGELDFSGGGKVCGRLDHDAGTPINLSGGSEVIEGAFIIDMSAINADARDAAAEAAALPVTLAVEELTADAIMTGNGGLNVIDVAFDVSVSSGLLTIIGNATDAFVFNVHGAMKFSGGAEVVLDGVNPGQVLWNILGTGQRVDFSGNSIINGTVLAVDRSITVSGGTVTGAIISGGDELKLQSGPTVNYDPIDDCEDIVLTLITDGCPGEAQCIVECGTPNAQVVFLFADNEGDAEVPDGLRCAGTTLGLDASVRRVGVVRLDENGYGVVNNFAPDRVCGGYLQALELDTCRTSAVSFIE